MSLQFLTFQKYNLMTNNQDELIDVLNHYITKLTMRSSPQFIKQNCSKFMKIYIDRLKRQRKREKKKISLSSPKETKETALVCKISAFPTIQHGQQKLLLLEKISPTNFRKIASDHVPSALTLNTDYLYEVIKETKEQRSIDEITKSLIKRSSVNHYPFSNTKKVEQISYFAKKQTLGTPTYSINRIHLRTKNESNRKVYSDPFESSIKDFRALSRILITNLKFRLPWEILTLNSELRSKQEFSGINFTLQSNSILNQKHEKINKEEFQKGLLASISAFKQRNVEKFLSLGRRQISIVLSDQECPSR